MSADLAIQQAKRIRCIIYSSVISATPIFFPHYLINAKIFGGGGKGGIIEYKIRVRFSVQLLSKAFLILRRIQ